MVSPSDQPGVSAHVINISMSIYILIMPLANFVKRNLFTQLVTPSNPASAGGHAAERPKASRSAGISVLDNHANH